MIAHSIMNSVENFASLLCTLALYARITALFRANSLLNLSQSR